MKNKAKEIVIYLIYLVLARIADKSLSSEYYQGANQYFRFILMISLINIIAIYLTKKSITNYPHLLVAMSFDLLFTIFAMLINQYLICAVPAIYFIIAVMVYYREEKKLKA